MSTKLLKTGAASVALDNGCSTADVDAPVLMVDRLATLSNLVSRGLARLYSVRFGLTISDWRVLAVISRYPGVSSNAVCELAAMDKVRVSRAVSRLLELERIERNSDKRDRRRSKLYATEEGLEIYAQVVPVARAYEAKLLAGSGFCRREAPGVIDGSSASRALSLALVLATPPCLFDAGDLAN